MAVETEPRPALRDRILEAARRLFITKGYNGSNLREIAKEAGVSMGGIYHHFASKEEIYEALLPTLAFARELPRIAALFRAPEFPENLEAIARAMGELVRSYRDDFKLIYVDVLEFQARNVRAIFERLQSAFAAQVSGSLTARGDRGELRDVHPTVFTRSVLALCLYLHLEDAMLGRSLARDLGIDDDELARQIASLLLHGVLRG